MPEISRFFGIRIKIYFADHAPPHFHAEYGGECCIFDIGTLEVLEGNISPRATGLVVEWGKLHKREIEEAWNRAVNLKHPGKIEPLK